VDNAQGHQTETKPQLNAPPQENTSSDASETILQESKEQVKELSNQTPSGTSRTTIFKMIDSLRQGNQTEAQTHYRTAIEAAKDDEEKTRNRGRLFVSPLHKRQYTKDARA
jgi:hypothetical protein